MRSDKIMLAIAYQNYKYLTLQCFILQSYTLHPFPSLCFYLLHGVFSFIIVHIILEICGAWEWYPWKYSECFSRSVIAFLNAWNTCNTRAVGLYKIGLQRHT